MERLETRELEYFVAVAEELHFGRAAQRLGMAQPHLSRAISRLERRMHTRLFERTSRRVERTPAGGLLLDDGRRLLHDLDTTLRRIRNAGRPDEITLAVRPGSASALLAGLTRIATVQPVFTHDPHAALRDGTADVALVCLDSDGHAGLTVFELFDENPVALLPRGHELAEPSVSVDQLRRTPGFTEACPPVALDEILDRVAAGMLVTVAGHGVTTRLPADVVAVPVDGLPVTTVALVWPGAHPRPELESLAEFALQTGQHRTT